MGIDRSRITGLVLAGGRGSRMGGVDKGLQPHRGKPLALHAIDRLRPQVGALMINANRNLDRYAVFGVPVIPDATEDYPGPLAGMLAGLGHCGTPYLATVPCDTPDFPLDLVARLGQAIDEDDADIAIAATYEADGTVQLQPVFCLLKASLRDSLAAFLRDGQRKIDRWTGQQRCVQVIFAETQAFFNANTREDLDQLRRR